MYPELHRDFLYYRYHITQVRYVHTVETAGICPLHPKMDLLSRSLLAVTSTPNRNRLLSRTLRR